MNWYKTDFPVLIPDPNSNVLTSLWRLLEPVHLILKYDIYSEPQLLKTEFENSLNIIFHKLKNLTDKEIKDVDRELIMRMFHFLEINGVFEYRDLENLELEIYRKYIFSQYFEKKFKALNDLREFLERAELASKSNFQKGSRSSSAYKDFSFTRYYTIDLIINWVLEQKVLENALKNATQIDIIKRCQDIIKFLLHFLKKLSFSYCFSNFLF